MELKILNPKLKQIGLPEYASKGAAAMDLRACLDKTVAVKAGEVMKIPLGFAIHMKDRGMACLLLPRSGLGTKGLVLANTVGLIDSDYQGEIQAALWNRNKDRDFKIEPGMRICQMMFVPVLTPVLNEVTEFSEETERGEGGFSSTGVK